MKLLFLIFPLFFILSCDNKQAQIDALETEVIQIHDEVMPKNIEINRLRRQLKTIAQDSTLNEATQQDLKVHIQQLTLAEESMSNWMVEYAAPSESDTFEANIEMLKKEKEKIIKVRDLMLSSLENGKNMLSKLESDSSGMEE